MSDSLPTTRVHTRTSSHAVRASRAGRRSTTSTLCILSIALAATGCGVYLHNPANQATADAALKDFQAFRDKSQNPYAAMLKNLEKAKAATADTQRLAAGQRVDGFSIALPYQTPTTLRESLDALKCDDAQTTLSGDLGKVQGELKLSKNAAADLQQELTAAKGALAAQFNQNEKWIARQALFARAIQGIAKASETDASELTAKDLRSATKELFDSEVSVQQQADNGTIKVVNRKIGDILKADLPQDPADFPNLVRSFSGFSFDAESSPGIAITILGLAVDLADAEYRKEKVRLAILGRKLALLERLQLNLDLSCRLARAATSDLKLLPEEPILVSLQRRKAAASKDGPAGSIAAELDALLRAATPLTILASERLRQEVELAALDHEYSIQLSSVNAQEHEALIGRGLEGLAAYHRGGLTPEEIANFIRAAQLAAMGVIGGRL